MQKKRNPTAVLLATAVLFFVIAVVFAGLQISANAEYRKNYVRVGAVITGLRTERIPGTKPRNIRRYVFTYTLDGTERTAEEEGGTAYWETDGERIGTSEEIFVRKSDLSRAVRVSKTDFYSLISLVLFIPALILFVAGGAMLMSERKNPPLKRQLFLWLPVFAVCLVLMLLLPAGTASFGEAFARIRGAWGYAAMGGVTLFAALSDGLISRKNKKRAV